MISIWKILEGVSDIPDARWRAMKPALPPRFKSTETYLAPIDPLLDDRSFQVESDDLWDEHVRGLSMRVGSSAGMDAAAWYCSFHCYGANEWGIYVPLSSVPAIDQAYFGHLSLPRERRWSLIWKLLMAHELMHFHVDVALAWFELLHHAPIRRSVSDRMAALRGHHLSSGAEYLEIEEALANAYALRDVKVSKKIRDAVCQFIELQPRGYCDGVWASSPAGYRQAMAETVRSYLVGFSSSWNMDLGNPSLDLELLFSQGRALSMQCPVHVVDDLEDAGLAADAVKLHLRVDPIEESPRFKKQLKDLHPYIAKAWLDLKDSLREGIQRGANFKKWEDDLWSVRVNKGFRAHLRWCGRGMPWVAEAIGDHKSMGHG